MSAGAVDRIAIAGAGIGGLTAAIALGRDHEVVVFERADRLRASGAGLVMAPNARRVLEALGVEVGSIGQPIPRSDLVDADRGLLQTIDLTEGQPAETLGVPRSDLLELLADSLPPSVEVRFDTPIEDVDGPNTGPIDGPALIPGSGRPEPAALVIGADGANSAIRRSLGLDAAAPFVGQTCWRGVVDGWGLEALTEVWFPGGRVGMVPMPSGGVYYFLVATAAEGVPSPDLPGLHHLFERAGEVAEPLLARLTSPPAFHNDLREHRRIEWGAGRVLLLGDAAHAMTPNLGQGASMAIEDAAALKLELDSGIEGLGDRYRRRRGRRVARVKRLSGRVGRLAHLRHPAGRRLRNAAVAGTPRRVLRRQRDQLLGPGLALADRLSAAGSRSTPVDSTPSTTRSN